VNADERISIAELADRAATSVERIGELVAAEVLRPDVEGRFAPGDVHRVRIIAAFLDWGIPLDALLRARDAGAISFDYYDRLHPEPGARSSRTYRQLREDDSLDAAVLDQLYNALGLPVPDPDARLPIREEALLRDLASVVMATGEPDLAVRSVRLLGDALRRSSEALLTVYDEAVARVVEPVEGLPNREIFERYLVPWTRFAQAAPKLSEWLTSRHLSDAIDAYSVVSTEHFLAVGGYVPPPPAISPAIAFVDLSGFTRLAAERGDERVARVALQFGRLAEEQAVAVDGRLVKLLGDGALLRFPSAEAAVVATARILAALEPAGMPRGHAGIATGRIIVRDGDVFGSTVNLAARLSDMAEAGQILLTAATVAALAPDRFTVEELPPARVQGFDEPVAVFRLVG
jgi:adenylate cyclase